jgi:hypothetical protein
MAAVAVTLKGQFYDSMTPAEGDPGKPCTIVAMGYLTDLVVGGGPIIPPPTMPGFPAFPIVLPPDAFPPGQAPGAPEGYPPYIWGAPIVPITPPDIPINVPPEGKPPPPNGGWGWHPVWGWGWFPGGGGKPRPPGKK